MPLQHKKVKHSEFDSRSEYKTAPENGVSLAEAKEAQLVENSLNKASIASSKLVFRAKSLPLQEGFLTLHEEVAPKPVPRKSYRKRFTMTEFYKGPLIVRSKNGDWFIKYWYEYPDRPGEFKEFRVRDGINYIHDSVLKEDAVIKLQEDIENALKYGKYNPFEVDKAVEVSIIKKEAKIAKATADSEKWTMEKVIDKFMDYCRWKNLSSETIRTYQTFVNNFTEWLKDGDKLKVLASEYLETDYYDFVNSYNDAEDWTPRTYNNHISFLITLFNRASKLERKIDRNVKYQINLEDLEYKTDKAEKNRAYSGIVAERVKAELEEPKYKRLKQFIKMIYLSCMRPKEIRLLRIENIDMNNRQIKVTAPTGKTGDRFVPISDELLLLLEELNFSNLPLHYYLFGRFGDPGDITFGRTWFSDQYKVIKIKLGLDIYIYTMYGWKHTRVIDLINAGFSDPEIMELTGHEDYQSFLAYKRDLVVVSKAMKGKTIGWAS